MASLLCSICNQGIHYHGIPNGIQFSYISMDDWNTIIDSRFDPAKKAINPTGYPSLFRTDTIEEDFPDSVHKLWKCPHCGAIYLFDEYKKVIAKYTPVESMPDLSSMDFKEHIYFDDYEWDKLTELAISNSEITQSIKSPKKMSLSDSFLLLEMNPSRQIVCYKRV